ncbi:MAG: bifunctional phosphoserine phosphatase/homoserine phosphotransferase ThrH [Spirochaetia bacterium]
MTIVCLDLEGVLIPEMWIRVAEATEVKELRVTTREIEEYDELMQYRLKILAERGISLPDIQRAISDVRPLDGAIDFLKDLRSQRQVAILSDTFVEFVTGVMAQLDRPLILCNELETDDSGMITAYRLRRPDGKRQAVEAFKSMNLKTIAAGDSFNDIAMIRSADAGVLFRPSEKVMETHPDLPVANDYATLLSELLVT